MRHPFAAVQSPRPASVISILSRPSTPDRAGPSQPAKRRPFDPAPPPVPPLPSILPINDLAPNRTRYAPQAPAKGANVAGHYVKHSSKLTLLLSGQREGTCVPHYTNGDTIEGILAIARPAGVLAVDVKVCVLTFRL